MGREGRRKWGEGQSFWGTALNGGRGEDEEKLSRFRKLNLWKCAKLWLGGGTAKEGLARLIQSSVDARAFSSLHRPPPMLKLTLQCCAIEFLLKIFSRLHCCSAVNVFMREAQTTCRVYRWVYWHPCLASSSSSR